MTESDVSAADAGTAWHGLTTAAALERQGVTPERGLTSAEAESRRAKYGPNRFAEAQASRAGTRSCASTGPDADRAAGRRRRSRSTRSSRPATGIVILLADAAQRGARPQPGGQGRGGVAALAEDDDRQGAGAPRRRARAAAGRAARARRRRRRSRPATSSRPTGASCARRRSRSPRRR